MFSGTTSFQATTDALCAQQDYLWFVASVLAGAVLLLWWRHAKRGDRTWIAWGAAVTILQCCAAIAAFLAPFNERQNPATDSLPPHITSDLVMGGAAALLLVVWIWQCLPTRAKSPGWKVLLLVAAAYLCWQRKDYPSAGGGMIVSLMALAVSVLIFRHGWNWLTASAALLAVGALLSPWGPVAAEATVLQRGREWSLLSVVCPLFLSTSQIAALAGLAGEALSLLPPQRQKELWTTARPFIIGAGGWLVAGLVVAALAAHNTRSAFESAALNRVVTAAAVFDTASLSEAFGVKFQPRALRTFYTGSGRSVQLYHVEGTAGEAVEPAMAQLQRFFELNPDLTYVSIVLPRDDALFAALPMRRAPDQWGVVYPLRRLMPDDDVRWIERTPHVEIANTPAGTMCMARAPLLSAALEPLGWLQFEFCIPLWAAAQAQSRILAFAVVALGMVFLLLLFLHQTRERDRETALRAAVAAEQASRLKTTFLANVSHELRTPIQSVLGYAELLHAGVRNETERSRLAALRQHGELMIRLVNDLIDLGMLESGQFRFIEKTFPLKQLVAEVVESLSPRAQAKGLRLVCTIDAAVSAWVVSDPERLRQVLLNLANNAIKFTDRGRVDIQLTHKSEEGGWQRVELTVRDTGPGIAPEEQPSLFEPFSRLANAECKEGAGLGLALTAGLCRRLGGDLAVESDGVSGSLFRTTLHLRIGTPPPNAQSEGSRALVGRRILVADDNALIRDLFVAYLSELGAECIAVANGEAALQRAADAEFDAVILDLAMPKLDGSEVTRRLRAAGGRQRIIGVSAHAGATERAEALAAGMDDLLLKPIELRTLSGALAPGATIAPDVTNALAQKRAHWEATLRQELPEALALIALALHGGDWPLLERRAHYLKNSALVVRDDALFQACNEIELAAQEENGAAAHASWLHCQQAAARWTSFTLETLRPLSLQPQNPPSVCPSYIRSEKPIASSPSGSIT